MRRVGVLCAAIQQDAYVVETDAPAEAAPVSVDFNIPLRVGIDSTASQADAAVDIAHGAAVVADVAEAVVVLRAL